MVKEHQPTTQAFRARIVFICMSLGFLAVVVRLFYWQVLEAPKLQAAADNQYSRSTSVVGSRGLIFSADNFPLVANETVYRLFAQPKIITTPPEELATTLASLLQPELTASTAAELSEQTDALKTHLAEKLSQKDRNWISLFQPVSQETKDTIEKLELFAIGFDEYEQRWYPEASIAATVTGFVGKNEDGEDTGYFGIEGALNKELSARKSLSTVITDALGRKLFGSNDSETGVINGRSVTTTIRRDVQYLLYTSLENALKKYGAKSGEIIVMDPHTGKILGMATLPAYDPKHFSDYPAELYKNPSVVSTYEPGSTLKVLTVAAGVDAGKITAETICPVCDKPRVFGKYTIRTWNDVYNPNITIEDVLAKSDNTAMIFISELLGADTFEDYLRKFKIGEELHMDVHEDTKTPFPAKFGPVELATISFGQGISTTSMQLIRAIGSIANKGEMMRPYIIEKVEDESGQETLVEPKSEGRVVSEDAARQVVDMMITSAHSGEAQWTARDAYSVAAKTGTSQIPSPDGGYEEDKTIASFIGFAPAHEPAFIMLVKLVEPKSSPWAAETAAPLWYSIADDLLLMLDVPPNLYESRNAEDENETSETEAIVP
ncbi:MAG: penicillin-binding protein 2 [Pseudomonadales bacterium]|nr:penicillin-binding protein 2 [Pseudomonadales bacterium]